MKLIIAALTLISSLSVFASSSDVVEKECVTKIRQQIIFPGTEHQEWLTHEVTTCKEFNADGEVVNEYSDTITY